MTLLWDPRIPGAAHSHNSCHFQKTLLSNGQGSCMPTDNQLRELLVQYAKEKSEEKKNHQNNLLTLKAVQQG